MLYCKKIAILMLILTLLAGPAGRQDQEGDKLLLQGRAAEVRKQFDEALNLFTSRPSVRIPAIPAISSPCAGRAFRPGKLTSSED